MYSAVMINRRIMSTKGPIAPFAPWKSCSEKTDDTILSDVDSNKELLQSTRIQQALGVCGCIIDEEDVISVGEVEEPNSKGSEASDKRGNDGVGNG